MSTLSTAAKIAALEAQLAELVEEAEAEAVAEVEASTATPAFGTPTEKAQATFDEDGTLVIGGGKTAKKSVWRKVNFVGEEILCRKPQVVDFMALSSKVGPVIAGLGRGNRAERRAAGQRGPKTGPGDLSEEQIAEYGGAIFDAMDAMIESTVHPDYVARVRARLRDPEDPVDFEHVAQLVNAMMAAEAEAADLPPTSSPS